MSRPTFAEIDLSALENNWNLFREIQTIDKIVPVIKANAYGHDDRLVAHHLQALGAQHCAVAMVEEAQRVREAGFGGSILILGPFSKSEIPFLKKWRCTPVVGEKQNLIDLEAESFIDPIHIKWDTGMNRLGFQAEESHWLKVFMETHPQVDIQAFCTHFLKALDYSDSSGHSAHQLELFKKIEAQFPEVKKKHLLNSDSFFLNQDFPRVPGSYGARLGISLYGYSGIKNAWTQRLRPVMTLKTKIVHILKVPKGQSVSYNASWVAPRDSRIAVLPIGYADGYPRSLSNKGQVFVRGQIVPLVGIVCMDYLMIDITDVAQAKQEDDVELWGNHLPLSSLAEASGTIVYELMTALTARVPRKCVSGPSTSI